MRADGAWLLGHDGVSRPIFLAEIVDAVGNGVKVPMLADPGADQTVLTMETFLALGFPPELSSERLAGIGGMSESVSFEGQIRIPRKDGVALTFRGRFSAAMAGSALDISLLRRDITNHFALVVDRPGNAVCLLSRGEVYQA